MQLHNVNKNISYRVIDPDLLHYVGNCEGLRKEIYKYIQVY